MLFYLFLLFILKRKKKRCLLCFSLFSFLFISCNYHFNIYFCYFDLLCIILCLQMYLFCSVLILYIMSYFEMFPYRYLFKLVPNFNDKIVDLCYYGTCYGWSSAFYCNSRHELCRAAHFSVWQLSHGLPSGVKQLSLNF